MVFVDVLVRNWVTVTVLVKVWVNGSWVGMGETVPAVDLDCTIVSIVFVCAWIVVSVWVRVKVMMSGDGGEGGNGRSGAAFGKTMVGSRSDT